MLGNYAPQEIEKKWQQRWEEMGIHRFDEGDAARPVYSIDSPPPFTSGDLHMGHVLSYSYFDFVARIKRMQGFNVLYPQGWDCQGFPTEVKVEAKFGRNLKREEFLQHCRKWTAQYIERMKQQMVALAFSPDWRYEYRTMSDDYHQKVQHSLLKMFEKKLVYRAEHPVIWCTHCASAIAKAETDELERETTLSYIKFNCDGKDLIIATTRPELLHACVAVLVHPQDERNKRLAGKSAETPLFGRHVKIIADNDVDAGFGTGVVMVCTFGDKQDAVWAYRHNLEVVRAIDARGRLLNAGAYDGLKADEARHRILEDLQSAGLLVKQEKTRQVVKTHDRCGKPVEFALSHQWFCRIKGLEEQVIKAAESMRWVPAFAVQHLIDWATHLEWDWVISRQRIFGTPIPFWHCEKCGEVVPADYAQLPVDPAHAKPPVERCAACGSALRGETSVLDCWVDSSITPLVISGWPGDALHKRAYPASLRPQGTEIIRTWAFYTIYRCLMLTNKPPFKELLLNGNVLAPDGKKMSKSLGNIIAPDALITQYSADAVRQWAALSGALAKDRPFSYKDIAFARSFQNKLWNASKFAEAALKDYNAAAQELRVPDKWILSRLNRVIAQCDEHYKNFDFHAALSALHEFFWHEFCDYYLEEVKHRLYGDDTGQKQGAQFALHSVLLATIKLLAPIAPHITEEIYQNVFAASEKSNSIHVSKWPVADASYIDESAEEAGRLLNAVLSGIRKHKAANKLALSAPLSRVEISAGRYADRIREVEDDLKATARIGEIAYGSAEGGQAPEAFPEVRMLIAV